MPMLRLMLRSDLCDCSDAYIVVKGTITVTGTTNAKKGIKNLTFKNNTPFRSCISKINNTIVDNAEYLDIVMPMYNLLEYSENYSMTSGSLWNYYRAEVNDAANEIIANHRINNNKTTRSKYFQYKTKIVGIGNSHHLSVFLLQFLFCCYLFWISNHFSNTKINIVVETVSW